MRRIINLKKMIFLSLLVSLGLVLSIIENMIPIPIPIPGVKLGLANVVFLLTLVLFGLKEALLVVMVRSISMSLATGNITGLMYGFPSSMMSTIIMYIIYKRFDKYFSLIGVSLFGALTFNIVQIGIASIITQNIKMFVYLPVMTLTSIFTGCFIGLTVHVSHEKIKYNLDKLRY